MLKEVVTTGLWTIPIVFDTYIYNIYSEEYMFGYCTSTTSVVTSIILRVDTHSRDVSWLETNPPFEDGR